MGQYLFTEPSTTPFPEALVVLPPTDTEYYPPSPLTSIFVEAVKFYFNGLSQIDILEYCLGFDKPNAPALAEHVVLIALKCSTMDQESFPMLAIGLHTIKRDDMRQHLVLDGYIYQSTQGQSLFTFCSVILRIWDHIA
jgi:hypothetical protein